MTSLLSQQTAQRVSNAMNELISEFASTHPIDDLEWDDLHSGCVASVMYHKYLTPNDVDIHREFEGLLEKFKAHALVSDKEDLEGAWNLFCDARKEWSNCSKLNSSEENYSPSHAMMKLVMLLSHSPTSVKFNNKFYQKKSRPYEIPQVVSLTRDGQFDAQDVTPLECLEEWLDEFKNNDNDNDDDNESLDSADSSLGWSERDSWEEHNNSNDNGNNKNNNGDSDGHDSINEEEDDDKIALDLRHLRYGAPIATYCPSTITTLLQQQRQRHTPIPISTSSFPPLQPTLFPTLCSTSLQSRLHRMPISTTTHSSDRVMGEEGIVCRERDVLKMVVEMLQGCTSDLFLLTSKPTVSVPVSFSVVPSPSSSHFCLSPAAMRIQLINTTKRTLRTLLDWFLDLGSTLLTCRLFLTSPTATAVGGSGGLPYSRPVIEEATTMAFRSAMDAAAVKVVDALHVSLTLCLATIDAKLIAMDRTLLLPDGTVDSTPTLLRLFQQLVPFRRTLLSASSLVSLVSSLHSPKKKRGGVPDDISLSPSLSLGAMVVMRELQTLLSIEDLLVMPSVTRYSSKETSSPSYSSRPSREIGSGSGNLSLLLQLSAPTLFRDLCLTTQEMAMRGYVDVLMRAIWKRGLDASTTTLKYSDLHVGGEGFNIVPDELRLLLRTMVDSSRGASVLSGSWRKPTAGDTIGFRMVTTAVDTAFTGLTTITTTTTITQKPSRVEMMTQKQQQMEGVGVGEVGRGGGGHKGQSRGRERVVAVCRQTEKLQCIKSYPESLFANPTLKRRAVLTRSPGPRLSPKPSGPELRQMQITSTCQLPPTVVGVDLSFVRHLLPPSTLFNAMAFLPLRGLLFALQHQAATCMLTECGLLAQLAFLRSTMLFGDPENFGVLREMTYLWMDSRSHRGDSETITTTATAVSNKISPSFGLSRGVNRRRIAEELSSRLQALCPGNGVLHLSATFSDAEPEDSDDERRAAAALISRLGPNHPLSLAGLLRLEIHHARPLDSILSDKSQRAYSRCLTLQLRLAVVRWASERCSLLALKAMRKTGTGTEDSFVSSIRRRCCVGLSSLLHVVGGVQSYLQHRVHGRLWSHLSRTLRLCRSVYEVHICHQELLTALDGLLPALPRALLLRLLRQAMLVLGSLVEAVITTDIAGEESVGKGGGAVSGDGTEQRGDEARRRENAQRTLPSNDPILWLRRAEAGFAVLNSRISDFIDSLQCNFSTVMLSDSGPNRSSPDIEELRAVLGCWE
eukprot:gene8946-18508_t